MRRTSALFVLVASTLVPFSATGAGARRSDPAAELRAQMSCGREAGSGRLICTVTLSVTPERALSWSDALVVAAPESARPLRARVASARGSPEKILIAFVLGSGNGGRIEVRARAVSCPRAGTGSACRSVTRLVSYDFAGSGG